MTFTTCPDCDGTRLGPEARSSKIDGKSIADVCAMQITDLAEWVRGLREPSVARSPSPSVGAASPCLLAASPCLLAVSHRSWAEDASGPQAQP